jgi:hypothetical protein
MPGQELAQGFQGFATIRVGQCDPELVESDPTLVEWWVWGGILPPRWCDMVLLQKQSRGDPGTIVPAAGVPLQPL